MLLPGDWPYQLGQQFLDAAVSCEFDCERRYVADRCTVPEGLPPGCPCQLVAVVTHGWLPNPGNNPCGAMLTADVRLFLDLCQTGDPGSTSLLDPTKLNATAQVQQSILWAISQGLREQWAAGQLGRFPNPDQPPPSSQDCRWVVPQTMWTCIPSTGTMTRWETRWRWQVPV